MLSELVSAQQHIEKILAQEENQFARTLEQGLRLLQEQIAACKTEKFRSYRF